MAGMLDGKRCIVTGGASGIGKATAREFAKEGARVLIADINAARLEGTQAEFREEGFQVETLQTDLSVKAGAISVCDRMIELFGGIDGIVNSHGITHLLDTIATETPEEIYDLTLATNLKSVFLICGAALPHMRANGGSIVNIASIGALIGWGGISYTASKGGLCAMSRQIAYQEASNNIRCNTILPGRVDTELVAVLGAKQHMAKPPTIPGMLSRFALPEEVAYLAAFLISDRSAYITSSAYVIDGGLAQH